jgi:serine/threonine protein kinase
MGHPLTKVPRIDIDIEPYLNQIGAIFRVFSFPLQDSGCVSYGVLALGQRWFVKHSDEPRGIASLRRAHTINAAVQHDALPRLHNSFETPGGLALVYDWVPGELLRNYTRPSGGQRRHDLAASHARFRALPLAQVLDILDTIHDVHVAVAARGFVAVDFYDGCIIYDFDGRRTYLCDLDEYRPGPFVLADERLPGSRRFMAPEEFQRGATIDQVTNVFTLGRTAMVLLGDGTGTLAGWRGSDAAKDVVIRATAPERAERHPSVRAFVDDWRAALG